MRAGLWAPDFSPPASARILQQLGEAQPDSVIILSLCDLYAEAGAWDEIVDTAAGIQNDDDITLQIRLLQARALREQGVREAALNVCRDALRSKKRDSELLKEARYERGKLLLELGKTAQGKRDLEQALRERSEVPGRGRARPRLRTTTALVDTTSNGSETPSGRRIAVVCRPARVIVQLLKPLLPKFQYSRT